MNKRDRLKRKIIELIHGQEYSECINKEVPILGDFFINDPYCINRCGITNSNGGEVEITEGGYICHQCEYEYSSKGYPITIGRVLHALDNADINGWNKSTDGIKYEDSSIVYFEHSGDSYNEIYNIPWIAVNSKGQECTDEDQEDDTIETLLKLLS